MRDSDCNVAGSGEGHRHSQVEGRVPESESASRGTRHGHTPTSEHRPAVRNSKGAAHPLSMFILS